MPTAAAMAKTSRRLLGRLPLRVLAEQLGVVPERELDLCRARPRRRRRPSRGRARCTLAVDVDAPRAGSRAGSRSASARRCTSATSSSRTWPPSGVSISRFSDVGQAVRAPRACSRPARRRPCRPRKMSPTSSPAISVAAARRTSPGLRP